MVYEKATSIECLVGYLYILDPSRLKAIMEFVGFLPEGQSSSEKFQQEEAQAREKLRAEVLAAALPSTNNES